MSSGARRAEGRARLRPTAIETLALGLDVVLLLVFTWLGLDLLGVTVPLAVVAANATVIAFVAAGLATVGSLVVEHVKAARTGAHSATRRVEAAPEVTRDILSEALAAIEASEHRFRDEHPDVVLAPPALTAADPDDADYLDLPDFARPVAPAS